jgi:hypothetical protein
MGRLITLTSGTGGVSLWGEVGILRLLHRAGCQDASPAPSREGQPGSMSERERSSLRAHTARVVIASAITAGAALAAAAHAGAEPVPPIPPPPAPAPPPAGPPPVPPMANPVYGQGNSGGPLGYLGEIWRAARTGDPVGALAGGPAGPAAPPPPGAGPPPPLPPGFESINAPESTTSAPGERSSAESQLGGPPLPEGYHPLSGPPPPGWYDQPAGDPAAPIFPAPPPAPPTP